MLSEMDCIPCLLTQALNSLRQCTDDPGLQRRVLSAVAEYAGRASLDQSPAELSTPVYRILEEVTGNPDPFGPVLHMQNEAAMQMLPAIRRLQAKADDLVPGQTPDFFLDKILRQVVNVTDSLAVDTPHVVVPLGIAIEPSLSPADLELPNDSILSQ